MGQYCKNGRGGDIYTPLGDCIMVLYGPMLLGYDLRMVNREDIEEGNFKIIWSG